MVAAQHSSRVATEPSVNEDQATAAKLGSMGDGGDVEALLQNRLLANDQIGRAALYDHDDFLCVASSTKRFYLQPDDVRKLLDGLLTFSRVGDPTAAGGAGTPPKHISLGAEGMADVRDGSGEQIIAELNGKIVIAARTAIHVVLIEGTEGASETSLATLVQSFQAGLQALTL